MRIWCQSYKSKYEPREEALSTRNPNLNSHILNLGFVWRKEHEWRHEFAIGAFSFRSTATFEISTLFRYKMLTPDLAIYISWVNFSPHNGVLWVHHFWWWGHSCVKFGSSKPFAPRFLCSSTLALNLGGDAQTFAQNTPARCFRTTEQTEVHLTFNFIFSFPPKKTAVQDASMLMQVCKWDSP